jgi:helicase
MIDIKKIFPYKLRDKQEIAIDYIVNDYTDSESSLSNLLVVMPTGYGKTAVGVAAIEKSVREGGKAIYLSPLKALTSEMTESFGKRWKVKMITGDTREKFVASDLEKYDVFLFTYEKFSSVLINEGRRSLFFEDLMVDVVVIDEIHNLGVSEVEVKIGNSGSSRASNLHRGIVMLRTLYPLVNIVGLSATLKNCDDVAKWLEAKLVFASQDERPVKLEMKHISLPYTWKQRERYERKFHKLKHLIRLYPEAKFVIFASSRRRSVDLSFDLRKPKLSRKTRLRGMELLETLIDGGSCYHNASLSPDERKFVEDEFEEDSDFKYMSATPTVAAGVNMEVDIIVIFDDNRYNWLKSQSQLLGQNEIHQMMGRAGRPNKGTLGKGIAVVFSDEKTYDDVDAMMNDTMEIHSDLESTVKSTILEFLMSFVYDIDMLKETFSNCFEPMNENIVMDSLMWLENNGFLQINDKEIELSFLGMETCKAFIRPETALDILKFDESLSNKSMESEEDYIWMFKNLMNTREFFENISVRNNGSDNRCLLASSLVGEFPEASIAKAFVYLFKDYLIYSNLASDSDFKSEKIDNKWVKGKYEFGMMKSERFLLEKLAGRIIFAASRICRDNSQYYDNLDIMVISGNMNLDLVKMKKIRYLGDSRVKKLAGRGIRSISDLIRSSNSMISSSLGVSSIVVRKIKQEARGMY